MGEARQSRASRDYWLLVEWSVDLGHLFGLAGLVGRARLVCRLRLAAEVEPERPEVEPLVAVGTDLFERGPELLLRRRARVRPDGDLLGRADLDRPVALQPGRSRDQLA